MGWNYTSPVFPTPGEYRGQSRSILRSAGNAEVIDLEEYFARWTGSCTEYIKASCLSTVPFRMILGSPNHISQRMGPSFVLAVIATFKLTASMPVADSQCPLFCDSEKCCPGYTCILGLMGGIFLS
ncbi:hypothetical protein BDR03DRAFT_965884, partial [Suillus americanus]